ncbi:MAG: methyltransferase domain-containing protein, partial [Bryobacteraceae bacterium]|nr:methyltransferase domain-containing protein [Bryobacteraceae bacterium]
MRILILLAGGLTLAANTFLAGQVPAQDDPAAQAERIRDASGVRGGLVVHVGCGDGRLTAALGGPGFLVHGLARSQTVVDHARTHVKGLGLYGPVSIDRWDGKRLPYADNLVNLLVSAEAGDLDPAEIQRVLAPQGVACLFVGGEWQKSIKPRPANIDDWTHYLHDSTGNPVSQDEAVGPPRRLQWVAGP